ncbi:hypothetical protein [Crocosphaera sp. Alani8]|uniref:hypothetical protein n=1 Tax=Crocosphaera sp. Alani8 TaxID=3038952 RepID=UPI00313DA4FD
MANKYTKFKQHLPGLDKSNKGVTLGELLAGSLVSLVIINLGFMGFSWSRQMYLQDQQASDVNQTLRSVFEIVGTDIKQAGEGFAEDPNFPSIVVSQDDDDNSEIRIRRSLLTSSLPVCGQVAVGTSDAVTVVDDTGSVAGCDVIDDDNNGWPDVLETWRDYRTSNGATIRAFIYNGFGTGEFFDYNGEETFDTGNSTVTPSPGIVASASISASGHTWQNTYEANGSSRIYLIEERRYRLNDDNELELIIDDEQTSRVVGNLESFEIITHVQQDLSVNSSATYTCTVIPPNNGDCDSNLPNPYVWSQIRFVEIKSEVSISDTPYSSSVETEKSERVFPRNILNY